jgi:hypothetical protein
MRCRHCVAVERLAVGRDVAVVHSCVIGADTANSVSAVAESKMLTIRRMQAELLESHSLPRRVVLITDARSHR